MNVKSCIAAATLSLMPVFGHASVVYEWRSINNETPRDVALLLEFDDATVQSGGFSFEYSGIGDASNWIPQDVGLISLTFSAPGGASVGFFRDTGSGRIGPYPSFLSMQVSFGKNLTGQIWASSFDTEFKMNTNDRGPIFEITSLVSDAPLTDAGCPFPRLSCSGATGLMQRVNDIPEPDTLALLGAGLFAASRMRIKKRNLNVHY